MSLALFVALFLSFTLSLSACSVFVLYFEVSGKPKLRRGAQRGSRKQKLASIRFASLSRYKCLCKRVFVCLCLGVSLGVSARMCLCVSFVFLYIRVCSVCFCVFTFVFMRVCVCVCV